MRDYGTFMGEKIDESMTKERMIDIIMWLVRRVDSIEKRTQTVADRQMEDLLRGAA